MKLLRTPTAPSGVQPVEAWLRRAQIRMWAARSMTAWPWCVLLTSTVAGIVIAFQERHESPLHAEEAILWFIVILISSVTFAAVCGAIRSPESALARLADTKLQSGSLITTAAELERLPRKSALQLLCIRDATCRLSVVNPSAVIPILSRLPRTLGLVFLALAAAILILMVFRLNWGFFPILPGNHRGDSPIENPSNPKEDPKQIPQKKIPQKEEEDRSKAPPSPDETSPPQPEDAGKSTQPASAPGADAAVPEQSASSPAPLPQPKPEPNSQKTDDPIPEKPQPAPRVEKKLVPLESSDGKRKKEDATILEITEGRAPSSPTPFNPVSVQLTPLEFLRRKRAAEAALADESLSEAERRFAKRYWELLAK